MKFTDARSLGRETGKPMSDDAEKAGLNWDWRVVLSAQLILALTFGSAYSFGAFLLSIEANFQASRFLVASIFSLSTLLYYVIGAFSGSLADRYSSHRVVSTGVVLLASGFVISSFSSRSVGLFLGSYGVLVATGIGLIYVPTIVEIQRRFVRFRARASGVALTGVGIGTLVGPLAAGLLAEHLSWEIALRIFGVAILITGLPAAAALRHVAPATEAPSKPAASTSGLRSAVTCAFYWWYFAAILLGSIGLFLAFVHLNPMAQRLGFSASQGNLLIGMIGVGSILGRLLLAPLGDFMDPRRLLLSLLIALAMLNLFWLFLDGYILLAIFAILFGMANGGCIALFPTVAAVWFGTDHLGAILGALYVAVGCASVLGGSIAGLIFDQFQSYSPSILMSATAGALAVLCFHLADRSHRRGSWA